MSHLKHIETQLDEPSLVQVFISVLDLSSELHDLNRKKGKKKVMAPKINMLPHLVHVTNHYTGNKTVGNTNHIFYFDMITEYICSTVVI